MALFKILSNMENINSPQPFEDGNSLKSIRNSTTALPTTYNQGYCYFDITTGKFWIDTAKNNANNEVKKAGRIPINAYKADKADAASVAVCAENDGNGNSIVDTYATQDNLISGASFNYSTTDTTVQLKLTNGNNDIISALIPKVSATSAGVVPSGTSVTVQTQTTKFLRQDGTWAAPSYTTTINWNQISNPPATYTPAAHSHGNISNDGKMDNSNVTIGNGDSLIFSDNSDNNKIVRSNITFDGTTKTEFLTKDGSWVSPIEYIKGTQTSITNVWTGVTKDTTIYKGKIIAYHLPYASAQNENDTCTLTLTLNNGNGNTNGPTSVYEAHSGASGTRTIYLQEIYPAGTVLLLIYNGSRWQVINKKKKEEVVIPTTNQIQRPNSMQGTTDVTLQSLFNVNRGNHFAFLSPSQIIIEQTTDGGTTWTDAGISDNIKQQLFSESRPAGVNIPLLNGVKNINCGLRVTVTAMKYNVPTGTAETEKYNYWNSTHLVDYERYNSIRDIYFWVGANSDRIKVKVERAKGSSSTTWETAFEDDSFGLTGWSGSDYIKLDMETVFGGNKSQTGNYWNYRFTFFTIGKDGSSTLSTDNTSSKQSIYEIRAYGNNWWIKGNDYAAKDHIYSWDKDQNVSFPASLSFSNPSNSNYKALLDASALTTNREFEFPDKEGTIALVGDFPTKVSSFTNDVGYLTQETDPTVPSWAKAPSKPSYSLDEITGAEDVQVIEALDGTGFLVKDGTNSWYLDATNYVTQSEIDSSIGVHDEDLATVWNFVSSDRLNDNATITLNTSLMSLVQAAQQKHLQFYVLWETPNSHAIKFEIDEINMATNTAKFHSNCGNILYTIEISSNSVTESPMTGSLSVRNLHTLTIGSGSNSCQVFANADITIPIYNGTIS